MVAETAQVTEANAVAAAEAAAAVTAAQQQLTEETVRDDPDQQEQEPDPAALALEAERDAWRAAERARLRVEEADKYQAEQREAAAAARAEAEERETAAAYDRARTETDNKLQAIPFHLPDGTPARLTEAQRKDILSTFDDAAAKSLEIAARRVYQGLGDASAPLLGKELADELQAKAGGKAVDVWLSEFGERYAVKSKYLTAMSDSAAEALVKNTPALQAVIKAAELREFKRGQKTPEGEPERAEGGRASSLSQPKTRVEADEMFAGSHKSGRKITLSELRAYRAQLSK